MTSLATAVRRGRFVGGPVYRYPHDIGTSRRTIKSTNRCGEE
jgi:hypothetical protein